MDFSDRKANTRPPFQIKICGIRTLDIVQAVADAGGDAVGLNFYSPSIRSVTPQDARVLADAAHARGLTVVGLFVNATIATIGETLSAVPIDCIQLHGDEDATFIEQCRIFERPLIRAIRLAPYDAANGTYAEQLAGYLEPTGVAALLLDAEVPASGPQVAAPKHSATQVPSDPTAIGGASGGGPSGVRAFGGSGQMLDWPAIRAWDRSPDRSSIPWILAGGLNPENVADAIEASGARSVDVASGVEEPRGCKSAERIGRFVSAALQAFRKRGLA